MMRTSVRLGDLVHVKHGFAFPGAGFGDDPRDPTLVTPGNFALGGGFREAKLKTFNGDYPDEYVLVPSDLIITMTDLSKAGDTLGLPALVPPDRTYLHNQRIGLVEVRDADRVDRRFLSYFLRTDDYRSYILGTASGSTVKHTSPSRIESYVACIPTLAEQRAIAEVLGALDDKIAANVNLANTADSWVRARLDEVAQAAGGEIRIGGIVHQVRSAVDPSVLQGSTPYVGLEHIPRRLMWLTDSGASESVSSLKAEFERGDVLFGKLRPYFHKVVSAPFDGVCSTDVLVCRAKSVDIAGFALAALTSDRVVEWCSAASAGTRMPRTNWKDLAAAEVPWPGEAQARVVSAEIDAVRWSVEARLAESVTLDALRDTLLPQLMSGKLRVKDAEKQVEAAV